MTHSFQFDPNTILGVSNGASLREIRDAYHQKSLKYHPDKGGDEWAFRMVVRAYEILTTARVVDRGLSRAEAAEVVKSARSGRPAPAGRPDPVEVDLGDGTIGIVKYRKPSGVSPLQALRRATRLLQERERSADQPA